MTHLSDEAVAACADGVLTGPARLRASRHLQTCAECATAVREQREAVFVLRAAPAPELPGGLLDRLRGLPGVTPLDQPPTVLLPDGTSMLATSGALGSLSALAPDEPRPEPRDRTMHRTAPVAVTAAVVALAGVLVAGAATAAPGGAAPGAGNDVRTVEHRPAPGDGTTPMFTSVTEFGASNSGER